MSYTKLNIGGEDRGLKFNQLAYITFYEKIDQGNFAGTFHYAAIWAGLKANAYVKGEEFTTAFDVVCDWVDEMSVEDKEAVTLAFSSTPTWKKAVEDGAETEEKEPPKKKKLKNTTGTA